MKARETTALGSFFQQLIIHVLKMCVYLLIWICLAWYKYLYSSSKQGDLWYAQFFLTGVHIFLESKWNLAHHPQAAEAPPLLVLAGEWPPEQDWAWAATNRQVSLEEDTQTNTHHVCIHCGNSWSCFPDENGKSQMRRKDLEIYVSSTIQAALFSCFSLTGFKDLKICCSSQGYTIQSQKRQK